MHSQFRHDFLTCGTAGWCMEIIFTGLKNFTGEDKTLTGKTSVWMFPIYGMASFMSPICRLLHRTNLFTRGCVYTLCIFTGEYLTGSLLRKYRACPWDYSQSPLNIDGLIRLDYAPLWFGAGLLFEKILCRH